MVHSVSGWTWGMHEYQLRLGRQRQAGMVHSVSGWTWGMQVELWDSLRMRAIPECFRSVFTTKRHRKTTPPNFLNPSANEPAALMSSTTQICTLQANLVCYQQPTTYSEVGLCILVLPSATAKGLSLK